MIQKEMLNRKSIKQQSHRSGNSPLSIALFCTSDMDNHGDSQLLVIVKGLAGERTR